MGILQELKILQVSTMGIIGISCVWRDLWDYETSEAQICYTIPCDYLNVFTTLHMDIICRSLALFSYDAYSSDFLHNQE